MTEAPERGGRAILLTPVVPDGSGVGLARRAWAWAMRLAAEHALEIVLISPRAVTVPEGLPGVVRVVRRSEDVARRGHLADWVEPEPAIAEALAGLDGVPPDRVVVFRFYLHAIAELMPASWRRVAELDCDDWEAATRRDLAKIALRRGEWRTAVRRLIEAVRYGRRERRYLRSYVRVHVAATDDVSALAQASGAGEVVAMPNRIGAVADLHPRPVATAERTVLFVGALDYPPNEDAIVWFGEAVLPRLRGMVPDVRVVAAGRIGERLRSVLDRSGIEAVHCPVDLRPLYDAAALVVAPVRGGGGTKLKVLEAWLHERPVVATSHALRGVAAVAGTHALVADRAEDFARACAAVLSDGELAVRLAANGRALLDACDLIEWRAVRRDPG